MAWLSPPRSSWGAAEIRRNRVVKPVFSEADLIKAISSAYQNPNVVSMIQLGANIVTRAPVVFSAPNANQMLMVSGGGQFQISTSGGFSPMFDIRSAVRIEDMSIAATNVASVFSVTGDVLADLHGLEITTSMDGYVFDLPGSHWRTIIDNSSITDDGTLLGVFGQPPSSNWTVNDLRLFSVAAGILPVSNPSSTYSNLKINNVYYNNPGGSLTGTLADCSIGQLVNCNAIDVHNGLNNSWSSITHTTSGTLQTGAHDIVESVLGYTLTPGIGSNILSSSSVIFASGFVVGNPNATLAGVQEQYIPSNTTSTDASTKSALIISTSSNVGYFVEADVVARQTNGTNQTNVYKVCMAVKNNAGVLTASTPTVVYSFEEVAAWDATLDVSGTTIRVRVTGAAATNISWGVSMKVRFI